MRISSESELYTIVTSAFEEFKRRLVHRNPQYATIFGDELFPDEKSINSKKVYLIGESHVSIKPVMYAHENLVLQITQETNRWLIFREGIYPKITEPAEHPTLFYFQELARLLRIPYKEALANLHEQSTRHYIKEKSGINNEYIDTYLLCVRIVSEGGFPTSKEGFNAIIARMSKFFRKPEEYILKLVMNVIVNPPDPTLFTQKIIEPWNEYSRIRFHEILRQYADRDRFLVSVGRDHLPAFK